MCTGIFRININVICNGVRIFASIVGIFLKTRLNKETRRILFYERNITIVPTPVIVRIGSALKVCELCSHNTLSGRRGYMKMYDKGRWWQG